MAGCCRCKGSFTAVQLCFCSCKGCAELGTQFFFLACVRMAVWGMFSGESSLAAEAVELPFPPAAVQRAVTVACIAEQ